MGASKGLGMDLGTGGQDAKELPRVVPRVGDFGDEILVRLRVARERLTYDGPRSQQLNQSMGWFWGLACER
ncbi:hypothetical protein OSB04_016266, partial [Centaurea solstitialis]